MVYFSSTLTWQVDVGKDVSLSQTRAAICVPCCWVCLFARICGQEWSDLRHCNIFHHSSLCWQECFQSSIELSSSLSITLPLCWQVVVKVTEITLITLRCRVLSSCDLGSSWNRSKHLPIFQCCTPKGTRQIIKQRNMITIMMKIMTTFLMKTWSVWTLNWQGSRYTSCGWCQARRVT